MPTYTIGETATETGFAASTLRYYESIGLLAPATRTGSGYRVYDDKAVERLRFVAHAKQLGCSLEEITDLVAAWDDSCGLVQTRLRDLVTTKLADAHRRIAELTAFAAQLEVAAARLSAPAADGPCHVDCTCVEDPIACTLTDAEVPDRLALLERLKAHVTGIERIDHGLRVHFDGGRDDIARFVADEQRCCAFWTFAVDDHTLQMTGPAGATDLLNWFHDYFTA